ncbi:MAG: carboxypeptidase regulatory-like domain-containing protein [Candidatus Delongbacteria bacterium]|nr:carboxypeptidase regulatory-like domain-containing protein [Candidatus Delongbacteria bacterium]
MLRQLALTLLFLLLTATLGGATGSLGGRVVDASSGATIVGAAITIPQINRGTSSDPNGYFQLSDLPDGVYTIEIQHIAYHPRTIRQLPVSAYQNPQLLVELTERVWSRDSLVVTIRAGSLQLEAGRPVFRQQLPPAADSETIYRRLREIPGVLLQQSSSGGTRISLDGCTPQQVLICVDGIPLNPGGSESVDLESVSLTDADRVEVIRGAGQTLFGSSGGGVVNFITSEYPEGNSSYLGIGSIPDVTVGFARSYRGWSYSGSGDYSGGAYPFHDPAADNRLIRQTNNDQRQVDAALGWQRQQLKLRGAAAVVEQGLPPLIDDPGSSDLRHTSRRLSASCSWSIGRQNWQLYSQEQAMRYDATATPNAPVPVASRYRHRDTGLGWEWHPSGGRLYFSAVDNQYRFVDETAAVEDSRGRRRQLRGGGVFTIPSFQLLPELEVETGLSAILEPHYRHDPFLGIRTHSKLGPGQLHLSVEQGLHYPTFMTQFPLESFQVRGNPDLKPEQFVDLRIGWLQTGRRLIWQLEYSHKLARDLIRWQRGKGNIYRPANLDRARIQLLTCYARYQLPRQAEISGSLQLQDPRNDTSGHINEGLILPLRQLVAGYLRVSIDRGEYFSDLTLQYGSRQYTLASNTSHLSQGFRALDHYTLTSLAIGRQLDSCELLLRIDNLFNQDLQRLERRVEPLRLFNLLLRWHN